MIPYPLWFVLWMAIIADGVNFTKTASLTLERPPFADESSRSSPTQDDGYETLNPDLKPAIIGLPRSLKSFAQATDRGESLEDFEHHRQQRLLLNILARLARGSSSDEDAIQQNGFGLVRINKRGSSSRSYAAQDDDYEDYGGQPNGHRWATYFIG